LRKLGLQVYEYPSARASAQFVYDNPKARATDVNKAFADKRIKAIFTSIGGDDSVRILPYLNKDTIRRNPKMLIGYSDTTTLHTYCNQLGLVTFNGPSVMAGFSQWESQTAEFQEHVKLFLFGSPTSYVYTPGNWYSEKYPDWKIPSNAGKLGPQMRTDGWHWLQGSAKVQGNLFGGCIEVMEFMKGTAFWPKPSFWKGKILFLETSEDKPSPEQVKWMLRNYGSQGILSSISGLLIGRARDYNAEEKKALDVAVLKIVKEFGRTDLPVVTNMDFGHTDPQQIMPLGIKAEIDCKKRRFRLVEKPTK